MNPSSRKEVNEYLFYEFGADGDESDVTDSWPFELTLLVDEPGFVVFEFHDDEPHFAITNDVLNCLAQADMTVADLRLQYLGSGWIGARKPVDLATVRLGDTSVPATRERRQQLEALGGQTVAAERLEILEGLYLEEGNSYLGLFRERDSDLAFAAGLGDEPIYVGFPNASAWRRLAWAAGSWLRRGEPHR